MSGGWRGDRSATPDFPDKAALRVVRAVVRLIGAEGLRPGHSLPTEQELRDQHGVARATVREAMRILESQGVVELRRGRNGGPVVSLPDEQGFGGQIQLLLQGRGATLADIAAARVAIEPVLACRAASRVTAPEVAALEANVDELRLGVSDPQAVMWSARNFHDLLGRASGNLLLASIGRTFDGLTGASGLGISYSRDAAGQLLLDHELILEAVRRGDGPAARARMAAHLDSYRVYTESNYGAVKIASTGWDCSGGGVRWAM
ncbi:FadR/GntR family transcriptional regulator [Nocardioides sediminis]|uniref:FadR/GntR family transcriptional regulator n=1 Tax=Nocardioides sediminis TaxID=433648 RepID=UPI000D2FEA69|nr:FCD domain-containing protein [Nocardioides sediminis]